MLRYFLSLFDFFFAAYYFLSCFSIIDADVDAFSLIIDFDIFAISFLRR